MAGVPGVQYIGGPIIYDIVAERLNYPTQSSMQWATNAYQTNPSIASIINTVSPGFGSYVQSTNSNYNSGTNILSRDSSRIMGSKTTNPITGQASYAYGPPYIPPDVLIDPETLNVVPSKLNEKGQLVAIEEQNTAQPTSLSPQLSQIANLLGLGSVNNNVLDSGGANYYAGANTAGSMKMGGLTPNVKYVGGPVNSGSSVVQPAGGLGTDVAALQKQLMGGYVASLEQYSEPMREQILEAYPELGEALSYYQSRIAEPIPADMLEAYRSSYRAATEARGWGDRVTSPGIAANEAAMLTGLQEQARANAASATAQITGQLLGMTGFGQVPQVSFSDVASYSIAQQQMELQNYQFQQQMEFAVLQFQEELRAAEQRNQEARRQAALYENMMKQFMETTRKNEIQTYIQSLPLEQRWQALGRPVTVAPTWSSAGRAISSPGNVTGFYPGTGWY